MWLLSDRWDKSWQLQECPAQIQMTYNWCSTFIYHFLHEVYQVETALSESSGFLTFSLNLSIVHFSLPSFLHSFLLIKLAKGTILYSSLTGLKISNLLININGYSEEETWFQISPFVLFSFDFSKYWKTLEFVECQACTGNVNGHIAKCYISFILSKQQFYN